MAVVLGMGVVGLLACGPGERRRPLILATTTSLQDSGLLDVLVPEFEKTSPYRVKVIAVGTGEALRMGERGDADVLLVHDPQAEEAFMARGLGKIRKPVMYNEFVLVGPTDDPAQTRGRDIVAAFQKIAATRSVFVSRGDQSGTHKKESVLWRQAGIQPQGAWYLQTGQGMAESLRIAHEKNAYILTDRATWLALRSRLALAVLVEGAPTLQNPYHVMVVHPEVHAHVNFPGAEAFVRFITGPACQELIRRFGQAEYGEPLFTPDAIAPATIAPEPAGENQRSGEPTRCKPNK